MRMQMITRLVVATVVTVACVLVVTVPVGAAEAGWQNRLIKKGKLDSPLVEVTPFVFKGRFYRLENWQKQWEHPGSADGSLCQKDEVRVRDVEADRVVSIPLIGCGLGMALVWQDRVYVYAGRWGAEKKWNMTEIEMTWSEDLAHWSKPVVVLRAEPQEKFFNVSVCRGKDSFVLLVESNDPAWPAFTFKYFVSDDLVRWTRVPDALYGRAKYVGGPALYFEGGYYYTLYLEHLGNRYYETRVARSVDLIHWQDAPAGRPFVTFNPSNKVHPLRPANIRERNASDAELCAWKGKTLVYFTGGDQQLAGDLQWAEFDGPPCALLEHFYAEPAVVVPSERQLRYQENQLGAFVHFGPATFVGSDFLSTPAANVFNPVDLDAAQWVQTAKAIGAKHIVLTAKHHNGFCLWPTKTTPYSVASSPWKGGRADVVREFVDAARKHGLSPGLYISAGDKHVGCTSTPEPRRKRKVVGDVEAYFPVFMAQLRELLTGYGELAVVWFDGAYDPFGWDVLDAKTGKAIGRDRGDAIAALVRKEQPRAVIFHGTQPDVRWSGSEQGIAPYPLWNVIRKGQGEKHWLSPVDEGWFVAEANIHTRSTWFWKPDGDQTLKSVDRLMEAYDQSIGRGANLLVNLTPDTRGLIPDAEVKRMRAFGQEIRKRFGKPIAQTAGADRWGEGNTLDLDLGKVCAVNHVVIEEDLRYGQRIRAYQIEVVDAGKWKTVAKGFSIGRKRIEKFAPVRTTQVRLRVTKTDPLPRVRNLAAYGV